MKHALELAEKGFYSTKPNPAVGCVLAKEDKILGKGWHHKAGMPHAERVALADAQENGHDTDGATAYVTLEPCSHYGRTPPCSEGLIEAKVSRVVIAMQDPNPLVAGNGICMLKNAGIEVVVGLFEAQARKMNRSFIYAMENRMPYVRLKMASSLDGRTAMANGESQWITGSASRFEVHKLRALSGAIITGIGTVLADDPSLTVRLPDETLSEMQLDEADCFPLRVVLDPQLDIPIDAQILDQPGRTLIICSDAVYGMQSEKIDRLKAEVISQPALGEDTLDLEAILSYLLKEEGVNSVMVEAGAILAGAFVRQGLVNELHSYIAPCLLGHEARPMLNLPGLKNISDKIEWTIEKMETFGEDIRLILAPKS